MKPPPNAWFRVAAWAAAGAALVVVFVAWQQPGLTVDLANWIRACF